MFYCLALLKVQEKFVFLLSKTREEEKKHKTRQEETDKTRQYKTRQDKTKQDNPRKDRMGGSFLVLTKNHCLTTNKIYAKPKPC